MNWLLVDEILKSAIKEDISFEDITTESIVKENRKAFNCKRRWYNCWLRSF